MGFFHIDIKRARDRVLTVGDIFIGRHLPIHGRRLEFVLVLRQIAVTENSGSLGIGFQLLDDQVVIFTRFDIGAILTDCHAQALETRLVLFLHRLDPGDLLAATFQRQLGEGIPRSRGGWRSQDLDLEIGQRWIDLIPGLIRVVDPFAGIRAGRIRYLLGQCQEYVLAGQFQFGGRLAGLSQNDPVKPDFVLDDFLDACFLARLEFGLFHRPRSICDVGILRPKTAAEQFDPATRTGGFHLGRLEFAGLAKLLRHGCRERVNGGGADDGNRIATRGQRGVTLNQACRQ